jgi:pimeloyl-ACP methyl ester carboxylesterase
MRLSVRQIRDWQRIKAGLLFPIVFVRGFAIGDAEIDDTTADPFNGFNVGSVLLRTGWTGESARHIFESPVLRLTQPPYNYRLAFSDGIAGLGAETMQDLREWRQFLDDQANAGLGLPPRAVIAVYRYYDIDSNLLGEGRRAGMQAYGWGLGRLIADLRAATGAPFVYIVAHSMGGLVARTFLQNEMVLDGRSPHPRETTAVVEALLARRPEKRIEPDAWRGARESVRRFFTYGTPHNGITGQGGLGNRLVGAVGSILGFEIGNFDRDNIRAYLGSPEANSLDGKFALDDAFCLVGTGSADYPAAAGFSRRLVGQRSDGLVELDNAVVHGPVDGESALAASAYVRRAHSGPYGMVNSEEGFGNLTRFLFGDVRIDGELKVQTIDLPPEIAASRARGARVNASYNFEVYARLRGVNWAMTERLAQDGASVFRKYDELFLDTATPQWAALAPAERMRRQRHSRVPLFTAFLDTALRLEPDREDVVEDTTIRGAMAFAIRLRVGVPDYEVDGVIESRDHFEGSALVDRDLVLLAAVDLHAWTVAWGPNRGDGSNAGLAIVRAAADRAAAEAASVAFRVSNPDSIEFWLPVEETRPPRFKAWLKLTARLR